MQIYIVFGTTGEYSDRNEWPVAAYADKAMAEEHVEKAIAWCREQKVWYGLTRMELDIVSYRERDEPKCPYDPKFHVSYTGVDYYVLQVELRDSVPKKEGS